MSLTGIVDDDEHTQVIRDICSLAGRLRIAARHVRGLYALSASVQSTDSAIPTERNED